jgi:hypothetical protein
MLYRYSYCVILYSYCTHTILLLHSYCIMLYHAVSYCTLYHALYRYAKEDVIGTSLVFSLIAPSHRSQVKVVLDKALQGEQISYYTHTVSYCTHTIHSYCIYRRADIFFRGGAVREG